MVAGAAVACGDGTSDDEAAPRTSRSAASGPTAAGEPALTTLGESATCADFLRATGPARENAARAALIVVRRAAGVEREPSPEVRAEFETEVGEACDDQRDTPMLDVMNAVIDRSGGAYVQRTPGEDRAGRSSTQGAAGTAR